MDSLPQELLDGIITCLPLADKRSLQNCSLVAKSWTNSSQKRLFQSITLPPGRLQLWLDSIWRDNIVPFKHTRQLTCIADDFSMVWQMRATADDTFCDRFRPFRQLSCLTLDFTDVELPPQIDSPPAFGHLLLTITLSHCEIKHSGLVALINHSPNLLCLYIINSRYSRSDERTPPPSRTNLRGLYLETVSVDILDGLSDLGLYFEDIVLKPGVIRVDGWIKLPKRLVQTLGASVKRLGLPALALLEGDPGVMFSSCRELQELELDISVYDLPWMTQDLISSITSMNIGKIILDLTKLTDFEVGDAFWAQLDDTLIKLIERPGYGIRLEVEFRGAWAIQPRQEKHYLPKFVEKGRVTVPGS